MFVGFLNIVFVKNYNKMLKHFEKLFFVSIYYFKLKILLGKQVGFIIENCQSFL